MTYQDYYKAITGYSVLCEPKRNTGELGEDNPCDPTAHYKVCHPKQDSCPPQCPDCGDGKYAAHRASWLMTSCRKKDVPKHACYKGQYCDVYVWVPSEESSAFANFTMAILDIATVSGDQTIKVKFDDALTQLFSLLAQNITNTTAALPHYETALAALLGLPKSDVLAILQNVNLERGKAADELEQDKANLRRVDGAETIPLLQGIAIKYGDLIFPQVKQSLNNEVATIQELARAGAMEMKFGITTVGRVHNAIESGFRLLQEDRFRDARVKLNLPQLDQFLSQWNQFRDMATVVNRQAVISNSTPTYEYLMTPRVNQFPYPAPPSPP